MRDLVIGFILTTVVGGALGYFFQTRSWRNQRESELREAERAAAIKVFEELSTLLVASKPRSARRALDSPTVPAP
jgi:hypothetical protein